MGRSIRSPSEPATGSFTDEEKGRLLAKTVSSRPASPAPTPWVVMRKDVTASEVGKVTVAVPSAFVSSAPVQKIVSRKSCRGPS